MLLKAIRMITQASKTSGQQDNAKRADKKAKGRSTGWGVPNRIFSPQSNVLRSALERIETFMFHRNRKKV